MPRRYTLGKREATKDETRARIVAAALRIYGERGVAAASNLAIARAADVAPATVRNHFSDPQDLANAAFDEVVAQLQPPTPAIFEDATGIGERVTRLASELAAFYDRSEPAWQLYRQEPDLIQAWSGGVDRYYANIDELMQNRARSALRRRCRHVRHGGCHRAADLLRAPGAWPVIEAGRGSHAGARTPLVPGAGFGAVARRASTRERGRCDPARHRLNALRRCGSQSLSVMSTLVGPGAKRIEFYALSRRLDPDPAACWLSSPPTPNDAIERFAVLGFCGTHCWRNSCAASSPRLCTPTFSKIDFRWSWTVYAETLSDCAISRVERPRSVREATCRSRVDRP